MIRIKVMTYFVSIVFLGLTLSCVQSVKHTEALKTETPKADEPFAVFFNRFNSDSTFQISRIKFPFKIIQVADEGEEDNVVYLTKNDWRKVDLSYPLDEKYIVTQNKVSNEEVDVKLQLEDTGLYIEHFFQRKDGVWYMSYVLDSSD